jgi:hypothetical protein
MALCPADHWRSEFTWHRPHGLRGLYPLAATCHPEGAVAGTFPSRRGLPRPKDLHAGRAARSDAPHGYRQDAAHPADSPAGAHALVHLDRTEDAPASIENPPRHTTHCHFEGAPHLTDGYSTPGARPRNLLSYAGGQRRRPVLALSGLVATARMVRAAASGHAVAESRFLGPATRVASRKCSAAGPRNDTSVFIPQGPQRRMTQNNPVRLWVIDAASAARVRLFAAADGIVHGVAGSSALRGRRGIGQERGARDG